MSPNEMPAIHLTLSSSPQMFSHSILLASPSSRPRQVLFLLSIPAISSSPSGLVGSRREIRARKREHEEKRFALLIDHNGFRMALRFLRVFFFPSLLPRLSFALFYFIVFSVPPRQFPSPSLRPAHDLHMERAFIALFRFFPRFSRRASERATDRPTTYRRASDERASLAIRRGTYTERK